MHHETLTVDLETQPFGPINEDRRRVDSKRFDYAFGGWVSEFLVDGEIVKVSRTYVRC